MLIQIFNLVLLYYERESSLLYKGMEVIFVVSSFIGRYFSKIIFFEVVDSIMVVKGVKPNDLSKVKTFKKYLYGTTR